MRTDDVLHGKLVSLRCIQESDCQNYYLNWLLDYQVNSYLETRLSKQTMETVQSFVKSVIESDHSVLFAIIENSTKKHIGNIKIGPIHKEYRKADVSYFLGDKQSWGKGYASEAVALLVDYGFNSLKLHRLQAGIIEGNSASGRVLEKSGFQIEGHLKQEILCEGKWQDHIIYGLINSEYKEEEQK